MIIEGVKYVTEKEISSRCGLNVSWLRRHRYEDKDLPHYILNRKVYYVEHEVDGWLKQRLEVRM